MNQIEITLAGMMDNYRTVTINFPTSQEEINEAYNYVSNDGMRDYEMVDYEADFRIDFPDTRLLNEIAEMKKEQYEVFLTFRNGGCQLKEAFEYATLYEYRLFEGVEDAGDIAHRILEDDMEFQDLPEYVKRHFDFDGYGEELESGGTYFWDTENKRAVQLY
jgi:Antirestriction protein (ArdA)